VSDNLTPTEELMGDVLAARFRLGENLWTFNNRLLKTAMSMEDRGLITVMHGIVEKTFRASLTVKGKSVFLFDDYVTPVDTDKQKAVDAAVRQERASIAYGLGRCKVVPMEYTLHVMDIVNGGCDCS
jgi:hypothetical protein